MRSRRKEDKGRNAWGFNISVIAQNPSRSPYPATGSLSSQNFGRHSKWYTSHHSKQEQRAITPPSSSRAGGRDVEALGDETLARTISSSSRYQKKQNAHLRSRRRAEQDDPREQLKHCRSGSHGVGFDESFKV